MRLLLALFSFLLITEAAYSQTYRRLVNFEWEAIEGAKSYEVQIQQTNKENAKVHTFKVPDAVWNGKLPPGKYVLKLRARDYRGVPGEWGEDIHFDVNLENVVMKYPAVNANIASKEDKEEDIKLQWNPVGGADKYIVEVRSEDGKYEKVVETDETSLKVSLPVAMNYTWKVSAQNTAGITSDAVTVAQFNLMGEKIEKPKIEKPENEFVRELKWQAPKFADKYDLAIARYNPTTKKWQTIKSLKNHTDTSIAFEDSWPGGQYRLAVRGKGTLRQSSDVVTQTFQVRDGNRSPAAEYTAMVRKSIDRVTGWYGIASYLITMIDYTSIYQDTGTQTQYKAIGGTGRLGLGWFGEKTRWGFLSILDLSGFTYQGENLTFASLEASAVHRLTVGERGELRSQLGLYYKELPGTTGNALTNETTNQTLAVAGPHAGVEYWQSVTPKLGLQVNAHVYMGMMTLKTPNGQGVIPSVSTQFGFLGSWRINNRFTGLMGYARREDRIKYGTGTGIAGTTAEGQDISGSTNETVVQGNYLNFFAEYAF